MTTRLAAGLLACLLLSTGCSSKAEVSDEAFCGALEEWMTLSADAGRDMEELGVRFLAVEDLEDIPSVDDLHASGQAILDKIDAADGLLPTILDNISDPDVARTFAEGHRISMGMGRWMAEAARDADSIWTFVGAIAEDYSILEEAEAEMNALDGDAVANYIETTCPNLLSGPMYGQAYDTNAKADVSTLGKEIATYYVEYSEPDPVIIIEDGQYYLLDTYIGDVSEGNRITDQVFNSPTDWCVEITNDSGDLKVFSYSARRGLEAETCR